MESLESQEAGFPPFPHSLEIPLGFPHSHGLDCGHVSKVNNKEKRESQIHGPSTASDL
jgi:hypothetical protein